MPSSHLVDKVTLGIAPEWYSSPPPLTGCPGPQFHSDTTNKSKALLIEEMISECPAKKSIQIVQDPEQDPGTYSRIFLIPKKDSGKLRPIIDLSYVNTFAITPHFKMETSELIRRFPFGGPLGDKHRSPGRLLSPAS